MILKKPTFKNKFSSDSKVNLFFLNKNRSNQTLPNLVCNEFNKSLITGISQMSDLSTINSITNTIKDKHKKLKKKIGIYSEKYNTSDVDEIVENKSRAFEALENLVLNDEILDNSTNNSNSEKNTTSNNNNHIEESSYLKNKLNNSNSTNDTQDVNNVNTCKSKKGKKCVSVPKLDFTNIYKKYNNNELNIKEVKYVDNKKKKRN
jgi:hypothetical protein